jgi:prevent-host-death family protein
VKDIGIRELKARASEIVQRVREKQETYVVTCRGKPAGILAPIEPETKTSGATPAAWDHLNRLADEISRGWKDPRTSVEILSEMRR